MKFNKLDFNWWFNYVVFIETPYLFFDIKRLINDLYHNILSEYYNKQAVKESEELGHKHSVGGTRGWDKYCYHRNKLKYYRNLAEIKYRVLKII